MSEREERKRERGEERREKERDREIHYFTIVLFENQFR